MFKDNKYTKWYNNIINNAKNRLNIDEYTEKHHIIPKCLGGKEEDNLVSLTAREHYICHWLLIFMVEKSVKYRLQFAFFCMTRKDKNQKRIITSRMFKTAKKHMLEACVYRKTTLGYKHNEETLKLFREQRKEMVVINKEGKSKRIKQRLLEKYLALGWERGFGEARDQSSENNPMYGKKHSQETKHKMSEIRKKNPTSPKGIKRPWTAERNRKSAGIPKPHIRKSYKLIDPNGIIYFIVGIIDFCKKRNLHPGNLISVAKGRLKQYRGWKCEYWEFSEVVGRF
jgi:uncharacterized protein YjhX (UPF0386 family)